MDKADEIAFRDAAVDAFRGDRDLERMLSDIGLHRKDWPDPRLLPLDAWDHALHVLDTGDVDGGQLALLERVLKDRPRHPVFKGLAARYLATPATVGVARASAAPATARVTVPAVVPDPEWDFFVSYTGVDESWAVWIAWELEANGYRVLVQAWDFVGGSNWVTKMQDGITRSQRLVTVLSTAYLASVFGSAEWAAMFARDGLGLERRLITARVENCDRPGLLEPVVGCDLFDRDEREARRVLLRCVEGAIRGRLKPATPPPFPGSGGRPPFPGGR